MAQADLPAVFLRVALLAEGVGRNWPCPISSIGWGRVALLAEGVGRNRNCIEILAILLDVALLAEGVGRNFWAGMLNV